MSQLILNIHDESIMSKLLWMLEHFKSDGVEVKNTSNQVLEDLSDEFIEKNWESIVSKSLENYNLDYENSFEYKLDRAEFIEMKGQL